MQIIGHRGEPGDFPENSFLSFRSAMEHGADGLEYDVRLSADGIPVIIHDETLERTTNGSGRVDAMVFDDLQKLDAGRGEKIPSLEQVLQEFAGKGTHFIELKEAAAAETSAKIIDKILNSGRAQTEQLVVISFLAEALEIVKKTVPRLHVGVLLEKPDAEIFTTTKKLGAKWLLPTWQLVNKDIVEKMAAARLKIGCWTVNGVAEAKKLQEAGVEAIMTDYPAKIIKWMK